MVFFSAIGYSTWALFFASSSPSYTVLESETQMASKLLSPTANPGEFETDDAAWQTASDDDELDQSSLLTVVHEDSYNPTFSDTLSTDASGIDIGVALKSSDDIGLDEIDK